MISTMPGTEVVKLDATGESLGRFASRVAKVLIGKASVGYTPNKDANIWVEAINIDKLRVTGDKMNQKSYWRYSGYPGGHKTTLMRDLWNKDPHKLFYRTVAGMIPNNKLKARRLKRLKISLSS